MLLFWGVGGIWAPPNQLKKVHKGPQVGGMYGPMSKPKKKPLTKSLGLNLFFFMLLFCGSGDHLGTPKLTEIGPQTPASGRDVWLNV
jgi:hypothetical protein